MTLRFAVLAHDDPEMLRLLALSLQPFDVWVHLDKSRSLREFSAAGNRMMPSNVHFVRDRWNVQWGGYSVVEAMRACATAAMIGAAPSDHIVFLSGRCYPIRHVLELDAYLASSPRRQFARAYRLGDCAKWHTDRYRVRHWFDLKVPKATGDLGRRMVRNGVKRLSMVLPPLQTSLDIVAGSQWMALTAECLQDAINALDTEAYKIFYNSFAPDEMAMQTYVYNSHWATDTQATMPEQLSDNDISSLPNLHFLRPSMSGLASWEDAQRALSAKAFFIRKLDSHASRDVISRINQVTLPGQG